MRIPIMSEENIGVAQESSLVVESSAEETSTEESFAEILPAKNANRDSFTVEEFEQETEQLNIGLWTSVAHDLLWDKASQKGDLVLRMMKVNNHAAGQLFNPPRDSAESAFTDAIMPSDEGYRTKYEVGDLSAVEGALKDLGVCHLPIHHGGYNQLEWWESVGRMKEEGPYECVDVWKTTLPFINMLNPKHGVILAIDNNSPAACLPVNTTLPRLHKWSDVAFLQWLKARSDYRMRRGKSGVSLQYVFRVKIVNWDTIYLINRVLAELDESLQRWPGVEISAETSQGKVLLGSPNGAGVGFLLAQHKRQLGHKVVDRIRIFGEIGRHIRYVHLLFVIKDVEQTA